MKNGFDNEMYVQMQSQKIEERIQMFGGKLYLEFGGKLFDDYHASRVLPGFAPDAKVRLLHKMKDNMEVLICVSANDIERKKVRADYGITYDVDVMRLIDSLRAMGIYVGNVVITQFEEQPAAVMFKQKMENRGEKIYIHRKTKGYPMDVDTIVSEEGYGKNPFIETTRPLVVVTAPGPGSGKLGTCLSQLYHEYRRGNKAGYAKFETFPVWNLPLKHPVNLAYEAATADLRDVNMIDPFHMAAYNELTVNYNRDIEVFPVVKKILEKISGECAYKSPTDMGVNMIGFFITDNGSCIDASKQEIIRRYFNAKVDKLLGRADEQTVQKVGMLMRELNLTESDRRVVGPALEKAQKSGKPAIAIETKEGEIVVGRETELLSAASAVVLNFIKKQSTINDDIMLLSPVIIEPILKLKRVHLGSKDTRLNLQETLIALSICAATNTMVAYAVNKLDELNQCEAHSSVILPLADAEAFRNLEVRVTSEAEYPSSNLLF